ncbi:MAG: peptidoglycan bridge formation glycyltransferase FemA/FemB family protein [Candidatus Dormibacteraeota bacterium]|uniref:Peptidoglycan bridge formation glycyltransferase FemA/FemB family protein n=1 Tax=Candidatus Dormiibacter inghamiae TaxID=3127013 RepID=A0A934KBY3_9BACT|nr:peptidoglycan bridge formation glycyltransferase FemA/FemB family protein [Candidatus Dormibacteraeota bacterium]MBJ7605697.1 peptidoglycan bridge formation glycyltransferase FemA/FemB family protein [Candidatus Dormibacteraeota bacterium]
MNQTRPQQVAWDAGLADLAQPPPLLQSWGHGEVQAEEGWRVERINLPQGQASVLLQGRRPFARAYVPRGPVPTSEAALGGLVAWARNSGLARLRVEPEAPSELGPVLHRLGFHPSQAIQPKHTLIVPLASDEVMLASFKAKHRYNIRLALKRGVGVEEGREPEELHRQTQATAARQGIALLSTAQYRARLAKLAWCRTYVARHEGRPLAAILVAHFGGRAYYLFGGSSGEQRELQPTYAAQWAAMRAARDAGCRDYDLWGIPPEPDPDHPWFGLWQFKIGFGGRQTTYCGAWDLELSRWRARGAGGPAQLAGRARQTFTRQAL